MQIKFSINKREIIININGRKIVKLAIILIFLLFAANIYEIGHEDLNNKKLNNKIVQMYYDDISGNSYTKIKYDMVTDIVWAFIKINGDGSLNYDNYGDPSGLISMAHNNGVKVYLSFQESHGEADTLLSDPVARTNAVNNLLNEVKEKGFDGVDNDIETATSSQRNHMTMFMKELNNTFKSENPNYRISVAVPVLNLGGVFNGPVIKNYTDYITIMAYFWDEHSSTSGPVEPILQDDSSQASVMTGIYYWNHIEKIPLNKILLGIPYFGYDRETDSNERLANVDGNVIWVIFDSIPTQYNYQKHFDPIWKTPWQVWQEGDQWHQLQYDDVESLGYKYDEVNSNNLAGISIWNINYGINREDLWELIKQKFFTNNTMGK